MRRLSTEQPRVLSHHCFVAFDRFDGTIVHVHEAITLEGGEAPSDVDVGARALDLAWERGIDTSRLDVLQIPPGTLQPGSRYAVDVDSKSLRELQGS